MSWIGWIVTGLILVFHPASSASNQGDCDRLHRRCVIRDATRIQVGEEFLWVVASAIQSNPRILCGPVLTALVADVCRSRRHHVGLDCAATSEVSEAHQQIAAAESLQAMDLGEACALAVEIRANECAETTADPGLRGSTVPDALPIPGEEKQAAPLRDTAECDTAHIQDALVAAIQVRKIEEILALVMVATAEGWGGPGCAALHQGLLDDVCDHPPGPHRGLACQGTADVMRYHRELTMTVAFVSLTLADVCEIAHATRHICDTEQLR